jgi:tetratricopeptide (TPR) repeat protein
MTRSAKRWKSAREAGRELHVKLNFMQKLLVLAVVCLGICGPARGDNFLILPFFNLSGSANLDWVGESVSETIREALASQGIMALDREHRQEAYRRLSIRPYNQLTKATVIRVGEVLDADQIIFGSFELDGSEGTSKGRGTLHLTAQIIDARKILKGPEYAEIGGLEDLARLQNHLAWQTLKFVLADKAPSEESFKRSQTILRIDAIESYVRGLLASNVDQKLKLLTQAVRVEPQYSQASYQLGRLQYERKSFRLATEYLQRVAPTDANFRSATFILGLARYHLRDFAGAEQAFQRVAESVPLNEVLNNLGAAQSRRNTPSALENFRKALEGDANDPDYHFNVGYALFKEGDLDGAAERFRAVLDRDSGDAEAITMLGRCLQKQKTSRTPAEVKSEGLERLKETYEESAYLQLKAVLERKP